MCTKVQFCFLSKKKTPECRQINLKVKAKFLIKKLPFSKSGKDTEKSEPKIVSKEIGKLVDRFCKFQKEPLKPESFYRISLLGDEKQTYFG